MTFLFHLLLFCWWNFSFIEISEIHPWLRLSLSETLESSNFIAIQINSNYFYRFPPNYFPLLLDVTTFSSCRSPVFFIYSFDHFFQLLQFLRPSFNFSYLFLFFISLTFFINSEAFTTMQINSNYFYSVSISQFPLLLNITFLFYPFYLFICLYHFPRLFFFIAEHNCSILSFLFIYLSLSLSLSSVILLSSVPTISLSLSFSLSLLFIIFLDIPFPKFLRHSSTKKEVDLAVSFRIRRFPLSETLESSNFITAGYLSACLCCAGSYYSKWEARRMIDYFPRHRSEMDTVRGSSWIREGTLAGNIHRSGASSRNCFRECDR